MGESHDRPGHAAGYDERIAVIRTWLLGAIAIVLIGWALRAIGTIAVPLVFAFFLTLLVAPVDRWVSERVPGKLGWLGHVAAMATVVLVIAVFVGSIWLAAQQVVARFADGQGELVSLIPELYQAPVSEGGQAAGASLAGIAGSEGSALQASDGAPAADPGQGSGPGGILEALRGAAGSLAGEISSWASDLAGAILTMAGGFLSALILVFFLTLLMLVEAPRWQGKLATLLDRPARKDAVSAAALIAERLRRFLLIRLVLGLITAALYVGWLWFFGLDLLVVWGLLAVLLNFIPTIGSLIAGILPVLYAIVVKDFGTAMLTGAGILFIEQVMGNFIDPRVQGRSVSLSSLVILIALLLWSWIWGVPGAFLAVPITITFLVVGAHVRALRPFALLISDETNMEGLERSAGR